MAETTDKCGHGAENCLNHSPFCKNQASDSPIVIQVREPNMRVFHGFRPSVKNQNTARPEQSINADRP
jgi:hypothetical protein